MARDEKLERARPRSVGMFGFVEGLNTRFLVGIQPPSPKAMATSTNDLVPRFVGKLQNRTCNNRCCIHEVLTLLVPLAELRANHPCCELGVESFHLCPSVSGKHIA